MVQYFDRRIEFDCRKIFAKLVENCQLFNQSVSDRVND